MGKPEDALKGFSEALQRYSHGDKVAVLAPWQQEALNEIDVAVGRLNRPTEDLLDVVRLQSGRLVLHQCLACATRKAVTSHDCVRNVR